MSKSLTLTVPLVAGRCQFSDTQLNLIHAYLGQLKGTVTVTWARPRSTRSTRANAYLWGVVYREIAEHTGMSSEDVHEFLKDELLPRRFITLAGKEKEIRKTTTELSPKEFGEYVERVTAWASQELGIAMPSDQG